MIKILINPNYKFISSSLHPIIDPEYFKQQGELLFTSRNIIKRFCLGGIDIVVKRYGHITAFNRLMYSTFRKSKAMRAYQHASQLREFGISTPEEIAMIETYKTGFYRIAILFRHLHPTILWHFFVIKVLIGKVCIPS